ncbi:hypothetical protein E6C27_scaffold979G00110 [Cucumis melo var. makuwa]|uniref:Uncharacterized protein n=1 Tax=Cucumis melo var. makuwa TaxID=1194695 RepID=A0A5A7VEY9_CUCMM|nr:hypothetical protein E6C27_scaffold979G00110 [Cucumis melo var. makuwa]
MESEKGDVNRRAGGVNEGKFWDELLCVKSQRWLSRVLLLLVSFSISTYFNAPPKISSTPTIIQLGSFHRLSRIEP